MSHVALAYRVSVDHEADVNANTAADGVAIFMVILAAVIDSDRMIRRHIDDIYERQQHQ